MYDRRGSNRSERPEPYDVTSVPEHADDARELLRALDAEPAIAIGRSYGGTVALELALHHPESIRAVALLEAGPLGLSPDYDEWFASIHASIEKVVAEHGVDRVGETLLREVFGAWEELAEVWRDVFTANGPALLAEVRGGETLSDNGRIGELVMPVLVVTADDSPSRSSGDRRRWRAPCRTRAAPASRAVMRSTRPGRTSSRSSRTSSRADGSGRYSSTGCATARSAISATTAGSASVVVSPSGRSSATSLSSRLMIFPERVFGSSG